MTTRQTWAFRFRFLLLAGAVFCWLTLICFAIQYYLPIPLFPEFLVTGYMGVLGLLPNDVVYVLVLLGMGATLLSTQWLLLRPLGGWKPRLTATGRPMKTAVATAALMVALVTVGLIATVLELADGMWSRSVAPLDDAGWILPMILLGIVWLGWTVVFAVYWRGGDRFTQLRKFVRVLIGGSLLETLMAVGVFAWNPQNQDCHCARGSYTGMVLGATVMCWAFGPGLVLLFMSEQYRRERVRRHCIDCGYDLRGCLPDATNCPECGHRLAH